MIDASVMNGWTPDKKLEAMQFRYVHQELLKKFTVVKVLVDVAQQEFNIDLTKLAAGSVSEYLLQLMMWAEANDQIPALIEWLTEDVISKVELLIEESVKLRQESEALRVAFATSGVLTEEFITMAKRVLAMHATLEHTFLKGGETHRELFIELENVRSEHEALLRDALKHAHK